MQQSPSFVRACRRHAGQVNTSSQVLVGIVSVVTAPQYGQLTADDVSRLSMRARDLLYRRIGSDAPCIAWPWVRL